MRRVAPGVTAVVLVGLTGLTGCGSDAGAATQTGFSTPSAAADVPAKATVSSLAGLAVIPGGFLKSSSSDPRQLTGPFTRQTFVSNLSGSPAQDHALLLNAGCNEGYQTFRLSPDRRKRVTVQLFKTASKAKALDLQKSFWKQDEHSLKFAVPGVPEALTDARTEVDGVTGQLEAVAAASITVGTFVAEITIRQTGTLEKTPAPDIKLATTILKLQKTRLLTKSG